MGSFSWEDIDKPILHHLLELLSGTRIRKTPFSWTFLKNSSSWILVKVNLFQARSLGCSPFVQEMRYFCDSDNFFELITSPDVCSSCSSPKHAGQCIFVLYSKTVIKHIRYLSFVSFLMLNSGQQFNLMHIFIVFHSSTINLLICPTSFVRFLSVSWLQLKDRCIYDSICLMSYHICSS